MAKTETTSTTEIQRILDQFRYSFDGKSWHGPALWEILQGITAKQANMRTIANAHTIWELVLHITAWEGEVLRRLQTKEANLPEEGDWCDVQDASEAAWIGTLERCRAVHAALAQEISRCTDDELNKIPVVKRVRGLGAGVSLYVMLHGVIQHNLYHAGQIALLKKALPIE